MKCSVCGDDADSEDQGDANDDGNPTCVSCRSDRCWNNRTLGCSLSERMVIAAFEAEDYRMSRLVDEGAPLSNPESGILPTRSIAPDGDPCCLCVTPLTAVCLEADCFVQRLSIVQLLLGDWNADAHVRVACETHGELEEIPRGCMHGKSAIEVARANGMDDLAQVIQKFVSKPRERRGTPVKERALKAGVELQSTPTGIRETIQAGSPAAQAKAQKALQRHQKACQQKVSRAEERANDDTCDPHAKRARLKSLHCATQAKYHRKKSALM